MGTRQKCVFKGCQVMQMLADGHPANQMMLVQPTANSRIRAVPESMAAVWVEGTLREARLATSQGVTGYTLEAESVRPYEEPSPRGR